MNARGFSHNGFEFIDNCADAGAFAAGGWK
jgi:hypothetical protein